MALSRRSSAIASAREAKVRTALSIHGPLLRVAVTAPLLWRMSRACTS